MISIAIIFHLFSLPTSQIAEYLGWAQQTVRQTIKRWQCQGLGGLWAEPGRGKKRTWQQEDWQVVEKCLGQNCRYSARQLSQKLFEERQIELGAEQIRRLLKKRDGVGNLSASVLWETCTRTAILLRVPVRRSTVNRGAPQIRAVY